MVFFLNSLECKIIMQFYFYDRHIILKRERERGRHLNVLIVEHVLVQVRAFLRAVERGVVADKEGGVSVESGVTDNGSRGEAVVVFNQVGPFISCFKVKILLSFIADSKFFLIRKILRDLRNFLGLMLTRISFTSMHTFIPLRRKKCKISR